MRDVGDLLQRRAAERGAHRHTTPMAFVDAVGRAGCRERLRSGSNPEAAGPGEVPAGPQVRKAAVQVEAFHHPGDADGISRGVEAGDAPEPATSLDQAIPRRRGVVAERRHGAEPGDRHAGHAAARRVSRPCIRATSSGCVECVGFDQGAHDVAALEHRPVADSPGPGHDRDVVSHRLDDPVELEHVARRHRPTEAEFAYRQQGRPPAAFGGRHDKPRAGL